MKKVLLLLTILISASLIFLSKAPQSSNNKLKSISLNNHQLFVEIADTDEKRAKGLSNREKLTENEGMLFVFPQKGLYQFWMKDMRFSLDFIWIDGNKAVDITENVLPAEENNLVTFTAKRPFDKVLEVNAGITKKIGINVGDRIEL